MAAAAYMYLYTLACACTLYMCPIIETDIKGTLNLPVLTHKVNIPAFMCFSVFCCLFVSVFELTRVDTYLY